MTAPTLAELSARVAEIEREAERAPWRVVLLGRVSVGKSTLVNRLLGAPTAAVGLGGVTQEVVGYDVGGVEVIDTPGFDDLSQAIDQLGPSVDAADAVIWVLDGLQPATHGERELQRALVPEGMICELLVARRDLLDSSELAAVRARVARCWPGARGLALLDLRRDALPSGLLRPGASPQRARRRRLALEQVRAQLLERLPEDPGVLLDQLRRRWRLEVGQQQQVLMASIERGELRQATDAARAARQALARAERGLQAWVGSQGALAELGLLRLIVPTTSAPSDPSAGEWVWRALVAGMGGQAAAGRQARAVLAQGLAAGELALEVWLQPLRDADDVEARGLLRRLG